MTQNRSTFSKRFTRFGPALAGTLVVFSLSSCSQRMDSVTIAMPRLESSALVWIAEDQHLFSQNGLNVTLHEPATGLAALDELSKGEADIAGTAEFPVVGRAFQEERIRIVACFDKADYMFLEGRRDRGVEKVSDLYGKRVGIIPGTILAFYLGRFLDLEGMDIGDVTLVGVNTGEESVDAIMNASVDAVVVGEPYASSIRDGLGSNAVDWPVQSSQPLYALTVTTDEWIAKHPELLARFLKSLVSAEDYTIRNPIGAKAIVQEWLNLDATEVETIWSRNQFSVSLDESLVQAMEDEARWMTMNHLVSENKVPDFLNYIDLDGLRAVKPEVVNIIR